MSTTKQLKVYKGVPTWVKSRAKGYWDEKIPLIFNTAGESKNVIMSVYDGLSCNFSTSVEGIEILDFSNTVLPYKWDFGTKLMTSKYCLKPSGQNYDVSFYRYVNFNTVGSPTINQDTGIVSNTSNSNYLTLPEAFNPSSQAWEIQAKVKTGTIDTTQRIFLNGSADRRGVRLGVTSDGKWQLLVSSGSSWINDSTYYGSYSVQSDTVYWIKAGWDGTTYYLQYSLDGNTYTNDISYNSTTAVGSNTLRIGTSVSSTNWTGEVDLSATFININNSLWWQAKASCIYNNFTVIGTPTISYTEGTVSNFSDSKGIVLPEVLPMSTADTWEFVTKVKALGAPVNGNGMVICQSSGTSDWGSSGFFLFINIYKPTLQMRFVGDSGVSAFIESSTNITVDVETWIKAEFTGTEYNLYLSTDGTTWTNVGTYASTNKVYQQTLPFRMGSSGTDNFYVNGIIYLTDTYIKINNTTAWTPRVDYNETLSGILYNYTDDGSAVTLDCYANGDTSVILTDDEYNGTYLGTVNIPAHNV